MKKLPENQEMAYYQFIKLKDIVRREPPNLIRDPRLRHDIIRGKLKILELQIDTTTPVHVGTGKYETHTLSNGLRVPLSKAFKDSQGNLYIPASTLKGVISHYYMAYTKSSAETAKLFGAPGYMSRILIEDAKPVNRVEPKIVLVDASWRPRIYKPNHIKIYLPQRLKYSKPETPVKALECIPQETSLKTRITIVNPLPNEVETLEKALTENTVLIGYGKNKGLGKTTIKVRVAEQPFPTLP